MPDTAVMYGNMAFLEGALKYGRYNWRCSGVLASTYVDAARRHLMKWWGGEARDPVTNVPHLANAIACISILIDASEYDVLVDDRPPGTLHHEAKVADDFKQLVTSLKHLFESPGIKQYTINDALYTSPAISVDVVGSSSTDGGGLGKHPQDAT